ncbi:MAG: sulfatase [Roseibacillus sp.]
MNDYLLALAVLLAAFHPVSSSAAPGSRPNVLFIAVDDMNDWIGCHGTTPVAITPNIDRLAKRGVNFTNAHTAGVFCAPSRAAIFSGQFASTTGCYDSALYFVEHPQIRPLQGSFKEAGYRTMGTGKLFHHPAGAVDLRGWDEFHVRTQRQRETGYPMDSWSDEVPFPNPKPYGTYQRTPGAPKSNGSFMEFGPTPNERENELADSMRAQWAVAQLKKKWDTPFFLAVGLYAPHFPNYCPQKYFDLYKRDEIKLPPYKADDLDDLPENIRRQKTNRSRIHQRLVKLGAVQEALHGYLACMSYADAQIGRVLDALEASPYSDNTIVVLWSDHGYHHGEKGDWGKHTLWERTSNVPFIWAGPGVARGATTDVTVSLIDMYPTLIELCNLPKTPHKLEGTSIASTLSAPAKAVDRDVYLPHMFPNSYAIMNRKWRYIRYQDGSEELYDVQKDPNEWRNLAKEPGHEKIKKQLASKAPETFAPPSPRRRSKRDLILEGDSFRWRQ